MQLEMLQLEQENLQHFISVLEQKRKELTASQQKIDQFFNTLEELRKEFAISTLLPAASAVKKVEYIHLTNALAVQLGIKNKISTNMWGQDIPADVPRYKIIEVCARRESRVYLKPTWFPTDQMYSARSLRDKYIAEGHESNIWIGESTVLEGKVYSYRRRLATYLHEGYLSTEDLVNYIEGVDLHEVPNENA